MKYILSVGFLPGVLSAAVSAVERRQDMGLLSSIGSAFTKSMTQKAMKVETMQPLLRKDATRIKMTYGPYKLKAANGRAPDGSFISFDPAGTGYASLLGDDFPKDITILDTISGIFNEKMNPIDRGEGLYSHHIAFMDTSTRSPSVISCGAGKWFANIPANVFMGGAADTSGNRYTTSDGQFKSGFYLGKNAPVTLMVDVVNYNNETRTVYAVSEIEYLPGKREGYLQASAMNVDIGICSGKSGLYIQAPKGQPKFAFKGEDFTVERDGYFLAVHGHMHDGGNDITLKVNGKEACVTKAEYGGEGHEGVDAKGVKWTTIRGMSTCDEPIKVAKGDKLSIVANFDMDMHPAREHASGGMAEAMALLIVNFAYKW